MTVVVAVGGVSSSRERAPWRVASIWACYEEDANGAEGGEASDTQRSNTSRLVPFQCDWCHKLASITLLNMVYMDGKGQPFMFVRHCCMNCWRDYF